MAENLTEWEKAQIRSWSFTHVNNVLNSRRVLYSTESMIDEAKLIENYIATGAQPAPIVELVRNGKRK